LQTRQNRIKSGMAEGDEVRVVRVVRAAGDQNRKR
jgi:hypothetical protein